MNKKLVGVALGIIGIVGCVFIFQQYSNTKTVTTNQEMLVVENDTKIIAEDVQYFGEVQGYFVRPEAEGVYPGIVMIHENRGLRPEIRETAEALAQEGYMVLAVSLLEGVAEDQDGARALTAKFNQEIGIQNMRAAVAYLKAAGAGKLASLGWCFGGKQSLELSLSGEKLDATVVYYGGGMATSTERLQTIAWPVLGVFGDQDRVIPVEMVQQFQNSLNTLGIENEIYMYPGVGHAFANPSGANYAPEATKDAWSKTLMFLGKNLK